MIEPLLERCESEAERAFVRGMAEWAEQDGRRLDVDHDGRTFIWTGDRLTYCLLPQHRVGKYRLDFLFGFNPSYPWMWLGVAVEIDGHRWHERTHEQAAAQRRRDRELIFEHKILTIRFAAIEVLDDARDCMFSVDALLNGIVSDHGTFLEDLSVASRRADA